MPQIKKIRIKRNHVKNVVSLIVGGGTTKIVKDIIENNTDYEATRDKAQVYAASTVLGWMAADAASSYTDQQIDKFADLFAELHRNVQALKKTKSTTYPHTP